MLRVDHDISGVLRESFFNSTWGLFEGSVTDGEWRYDMVELFMALMDLKFEHTLSDCVGCRANREIYEHLYGPV